MEKPICIVGSIRQLRFAFCICFLFWFLSYIHFDDCSILLPRDSETKTNLKNSCSGRYVYIHDIPRRFNDEILTGNCSVLLKWPESDMCRAISNMGLGPRIPRSHGNGAEGGFLESNSWFVTHPNLLEVIFHNRMKQYKCLTNDSSLASAIYVPFYAGLDLGRYLWGFNSSTRDSGPIDLFKWLVEKPEWERMSGRDHFFVAGRTTWDFRSLTSIDRNWGNNLMYLPQAKNVTILSLESSHSIKRDFAIPYPTNFHPSSNDQVIEWQNKMRKQKRKYLFSFIGAPRPQQQDSIRGEIISQCLGAGKKCKWLDCKSSSSENCDNPSYVTEMFRRSTFCLQPRGDTATRRSTFDSILAGCIPVFFHTHTAYDQYVWHLPKEHRKYSVFIPENQVKNGKAEIEKTLSAISEEEVVKMREEVIRLIPNIICANPSSSSSGLETFEDAVDLAVKGVLERVEELREDMKEK